MDAPSKAAFWKVVKRLSDPAPIPISVTAHDLKSVFEKRLNPPETLPEGFDRAQHRMNQLLEALIPNFTEDSIPEGFFTAKFTVKDIEWLKDHLRKNSMDSAAGEDAVIYEDIREIPNDALADFLNDYRIIALESCFLKLLTLLIHKRITDWANSRNIIPDYQNGFRAGYRTNNNPFVLRCVKEWARADGRTLFVATVDATNAFPSTDQPTLWLNLVKLGMGGALFDWLRMLYRRM
ncbi:hypothetical protein C8R45DRAFT_825285 [Mycena sanguinolenta]|nr:hypothetical protein C8R45DRAFT_825285 [Mycena sanguinolenta]